jgi:hypothetical protein
MRRPEGPGQGGGVIDARAIALPRPRPRTRAARLAAFVGVELLMWVAFYGAYLAIRGVAIGAEPTAMANAHGLIDVERALGIFHEARIQDWFRPVVDGLSLYYMLGFGPLVGVVLIWLAAADRVTYKWLRTALLVSVGIASVIHVLLPMAPPRLVEGLGIADTVGLSGGHDQGSFMGISFNPYAAMPSMHVGWSLLIGVAGFRAARSRPLRAFFAAHPAVMTLTVVATGNHYLLDALAGATVVGAALLLIQAARRTDRLVPIGRNSPC